MAGSAVAEGPGGRTSRFLDAVVAFVVAVFQPIFHVLVSVISPSKSTSRDQHNNQESPPSPPQQQQNNKDQSASGTQHSKHHDASTTTPHEGDFPSDSDAHPDHDPQRMASPLQNQSAAANRSQQPMEVKPNGQASAKVVLPRLDSSKEAVKQENVPSTGNGGSVKPTRRNDRDVANAPTNGHKYRDVGDEQAQENRQDQLTLPPPVSEPEVPQDCVDGGEDELEDPATAAERAIHHGFMHQALDMARLSLKTNETPVGCVLVHDGRVIARGMNATNITRNGTRHAELMALTALLSFTPKADVEEKVQDKVQEMAQEKKKSKRKSKNNRPASQEADKPALTRAYTEQDWGDVDPKDGHIYPYGQKLHPAPRVDRSLLSECTLYVTVEPCVMCASMLRQFNIKKVYFGAVNDKFGGTGGVFCIHMNSDPAHAASVPTTPVHRPVANQLPRPTLPHKAASCTSSINGSQDGSAVNGGEVKSVNSITFVEPPVPVSNMSMGHGGNVEMGFDAEGGWGRDEAVNLLRQFYVQENGRAPVPRKKEGRAARLAAMMESQGMTTEGTALQGLLQQEREALEREKATAAENGSVDPNAEVETDLKAGAVKGPTEACGATGVEGTQATEDQHMRDTMMV